MKKLISAIFILAMIPALAEAQGNDRRAWGYLFGGAGGVSESSTAFLHIGGGGEGLVYKGLGLGAEVGYFTPFSRFSDGVGILSVDVSHHFNRKEKLVPFVTGGYSLGFRSGSSSGGNFGGGVQYWASDRVGLRFEFRDHIFSSDSPHFYSFRAGISFR